MPTPEWTLLTRQSCTLCEEFKEELAAALGAAENARVQVVDVDSDPDLRRKYGARIPVLLADGEFVCQYRVDPTRLASYIRPNLV